MLLTRRFVYRPGKQADTGGLVAQAHAATGGRVPVWVFLEESREGKKVSAIDRALQKFPALAELGPLLPAGALRYSMTSLPADEETLPCPQRSIDAALAAEIAQGVPRSLPFDATCFTFAPVPELWLTDGAWRPPDKINARRSAHGGEIVVQSRWGTPRRRLELEAAVALTPPDGKLKKLPKLPPATQAVIDALGKPHHEEHRLEATVDEEIASNRIYRERGRPLADAAELALREGLPRPDVAGDRGGDGEAAFGAMKDILAEALGAGWKYQSKLGYAGRWVLTKRAESQHLLALVVSRGPLNGEAIASFLALGPLVHYGVTLPVNRHGATKVACWNGGTTRELARNWAHGAERLERELVPQLASLHGPGWAWYTPPI